MNHYRISSPRKSFALCALALTAFTVALAVVVPARLEPGNQNVQALGPSKAIAPASAEAVVERFRIEVVGVREPALLSVDLRKNPAKPKQDS